MASPNADSDHLLPPAIVQTRLVILATYYALIAYFLVGNVIFFQGIGLAAITVWLVQIVPLLLFSVGLHRTHLRTYAWMCFVVLLYFTHGVLVAFDPPRLWLGLLQISLCVIMFSFLILFIRQYRNHFEVNL